MTLNFSPGEWELTPKDLATLFLFKKWPYATPTLGYGLPTEDEIKQLFSELVAEILADGRPSVMASRGRFLAVSHEDLPDSVDLYLNVGYVWADEEVLTEDEFEALQEMGLIDDEEEFGDE